MSFSSNKILKYLKYKNCYCNTWNFFYNNAILKTQSEQSPPNNFVKYCILSTTLSIFNNMVKVIFKPHIPRSYILIEQTNQRWVRVENQGQTSAWFLFLQKLLELCKQIYFYKKISRCFGDLNQKHLYWVSYMAMSLVKNQGGGVKQILNISLQVCKNLKRFKIFSQKI